MSLLPDKFSGYLAACCEQMLTGIKGGKHHDQRRAQLMDFLMKTFKIEVDEIDLSPKIKAASARGLIDASNNGEKYASVFYCAILLIMIGLLAIKTLDGPTGIE